MAMEGAVAAIPAAHTIGALSLELGPLKGALKAEAVSWKAQFAKNLHAKGAEDLRVGSRASYSCSVAQLCADIILNHRDDLMPGLSLTEELPQLSSSSWHARTAVSRAGSQQSMGAWWPCRRSRCT